MTFVITYETLFDLLRKEKSREDLQALPNNFYHDVLDFMKKKDESTKVSGSLGQRSLIEFNNIKKILKEFYERRERKILLLALNKARTESAIIDSSILLPQEKGLFNELVQALKMNKRAVIDSVFNLQSPIVGEASKTEDETIKLHQSDMLISGDVKKERNLNKKELKKSKDELKESPDELIKSTEESKESTEELKDELKVSEKSIINQKADQESKEKKVNNDTNVKFLASIPKFLGKDMKIFGPYNEGDTAELPTQIANILIKKGRAEEL